MTYNYCTLFDSYYLNRAIAMYESLQKNCPEFRLFIFAFDERSESILLKLNLKNVTIISLNDFENDQLRAVKEHRTKAEYCWTCTPSTIHYCITRFNLDHCTYIDADLYFFSNPNLLVDEMKDNSVLITEHRYTRRYDQSKTSGLYCVQFITFRNTAEGMKVLTWWRDRCIEWCYDRFEAGKFGDQKYLDDWLTRFTGVHVLQDPGGGVAPWNVQQFDIKQSGDSIKVIKKETGTEHDLVFFHFHAVRFLKDEWVDLGSYALSTAAKTVYLIYLEHIVRVNTLLAQFYFNPIVQAYQTKKSLPIFLHKMVRRVLGLYHVYNLNSFIKNGKTT
jgi:hypothetical protein